MRPLPGGDALDRPARASPDLEGRNVAIVCVSTDESAEALRRYLKDKDWKMTILQATSIPPAFQTEGIPATFLITPEGKIAVAEIGAARWTTRP